MDELQGLAGLAGAPVVLALVQVLKPVVRGTRWHPVLALGCGVAWNLALALALGQSLAPAAVLGMVTGLAAAGLYSGTRATVGK